MTRFLIVISLVLFGLTAEAQSGRQHRPLYQIGGKYSPNGWHFGPGLTYMIPNASQRTDTRLLNTESGVDTLYSGTFDAAGKLGLYLEVGRQHFVKDPVFVHYFDFGLHWKQFRASENFNGRVNTGDSLLVSVNNQGSFSHGYLGIYGNANHITQLNDWSFLQFSLGANVDYRLIDRRTYEGPELLNTVEEAGPLQAQLHAKLGYGIRLESGVFIIPTIETPILNIYPFYDGKSTLPMFNTRYRPIILSVRILLFSYQKVGDCVGKGTEKRGDQLWGKKMRKKYGR
ncbi:hypothetical protein [Sanyastnella coralliicola]|uniref:hypothetical protein n=1 Tax=Sanyastnella coralliicola TaxID=3069118 RepID=UPI0027BAAF2D|nr:hypothetical protein [Longitalea sp. SCSIO 12813]